MPNYGNSNLKVSDAITVAEVGGIPDAYPTHYAFLGKGGWRSATSLSVLNATSSLRLEAGCAGYVFSDQVSSNNGLYVYNGTSWVKTSLSPTAYSLPIASSSVLGGVRIPSGGPISINSGNGDLSLRIATTSLTGIVKVGDGLSVDNDGVLSVTAADLTVINADGSYSQSYPKLRFSGSGITSVTEDSSNDENIVTIDAPTATVSTISGEFTNIVFASGGGVGVSGNYNSGTKTYTVTYSITSSGTLKQNLHELDDVNSNTVANPSNGDMLLFTGSKWNAVKYTAGIALTSLSASSPISYNSSTGVFSMSAANSTTDGYLSSTNWSTFNNKQNALTLTTTGTSGAATLSGSTLNIPQYSGANGTVTSVDFTTNTNGTDVSSTVTGKNSQVEITLSIPNASSSNRGVITSSQFDIFNSVTNKLNITASTNGGSGTTVTLDFSQPDTIYGTVASPVTGNLSCFTNSGKVGVTHIVVHNSSTTPTITGALKLSGSGNYKPSSNNYIYFTYISGTTVIYSINQAS